MNLEILVVIVVILSLALTMVTILCHRLHKDNEDLEFENSVLKKEIKDLKP